MESRYNDPNKDMEQVIVTRKQIILLLEIRNQKVACKRTLLNVLEKYDFLESTIRSNFRYFHYHGMLDRQINYYGSDDVNEKMEMWYFLTEKGKEWLKMNDLIFNNYYKKKTKKIRKSKRRKNVAR